MHDLPVGGRFEGVTHLLPVRVYYEDTDFSGLVYHANYVRYFERGRSDYLRAAGIAHAALLAGPEPTAFAALKLTVTFLKPARIDDALVVRTRFEAIRGARLFVAQEVARAGEAVAQAAVELCCIRPGGGAKRFPAALAAKLAPYLAAPASPF